MSNKIAAIIVDTVQLTIYNDDASSYTIPQGDPRVRYIVDNVLPRLDRGETVEADFSTTLISNDFQQFEERSHGFVRFFKSTKKALASIFKSPEQLALEADGRAEEGSHGTVPELTLTNIAPQATEQQEAVAEIMANAVPSKDFDENNLTSEETIVAVVDGKVIPGVEQLMAHVKHSNLIGSSTGIHNFFRRIASVIDKRRHSVEDLVKFLEKADLPIADDGSIIGYKLLYSLDSETYVDPHTRNVRQRVGSYVHMDENMVDPNRLRDCSNGLHVGRRDYMGSFSGDTCMLIKMAPEDVIAVPEYDARKIRVCGYHIIGKINAEGFRLVMGNQSMTNNSYMGRMLADAIAGNHIGITERVHIGGSRGTQLTITPVSNEKAKAIASVGASAETVDAVLQKQNKIDVADVVKGQLAQAPKAEAKTIPSKPETKAAPTPVAVAKSISTSGGNSRQAHAGALNEIMLNTKHSVKTRQDAAADLQAFKRKAKVSWTALGLSTETPKHIDDVLKLSDTKPKTKPAPKAKAKLETVRSPNQTDQPLSRKERAAQLLGVFMTTTDPEHRYKAAQQLVELKKTSKVGWYMLGIDDDTRKLAVKIAEGPAPVKPVAAPTPKVIAKPSPKAKAKAAPAKVAAPSKESRSQKAQRLFKEKKWSELLTHKKAAKVSWPALGFFENEVQEILLHVGD